MNLTINDVFPEWITNGIFTALNKYDVPWKTAVDPNALNVAYHGNKSGNKIISPLVERFLDTTTGELSTENIDKIASSIFTIYNTNWVKLWATLSLEYNPIENYSMIETETGTETGNGTESGINTINHTGTNTNEQTGTNILDSTTTGTNTGNTNNSIYGFNSSYAVNADTQNETDTTNGTEKNTETRDLTHTETHNTTDEENRDITTTNNKTNERTLKRSGNIGVTTSQQMLESERSLWNWVFYDTVFNNIDSMLSLAIY